MSLKSSAPPLGRLAIELDDLPSQVQNLHLVAFDIEVSSLEEKLSQLTSLRSLWDTAPDYDVMGVLQCLPRLEVRLSEASQVE